MIFGRRAGSEVEKNELERIQHDYQSVFGTEPGKRVLTDILRMFGYWEHDPEFPDLRRAAITLLDRGGWLHAENIQAIVDGYIKAGQVNDIESEPAQEELTWRSRERTQR